MLVNDKEQKIFLNPYLVGYFENGNLIIKEPNSKRSFAIDSKLYDLLLDSLKGLDTSKFFSLPTKLTKAIDFLIANKILICSNDELLNRFSNSFLIKNGFVE